jgi:hypothetical protein
MLLSKAAASKMAIPLGNVNLKTNVIRKRHPKSHATVHLITEQLWTNASRYFYQALSYLISHRQGISQNKNI